MTRFLALFAAALVSGASSPSGRPTAPIPRDVRLIGRWDITITTPTGTAPSWIEIDSSGRDALIGQIVGIVGSARPISEIIAAGDSLRFAVPHQWEAGDGDLRVVFRLQGDRLVGRMTFPDNTTMNWQGVRAPRLIRTSPPRWGVPITLLNQNDLNGWQPMGKSNQWVVRNGVLTSPRSGVNLRTARTFGDFKLHIEFRYPARGNSGIYLRGRHELQIEDPALGVVASEGLGAIYGFIPPNESAGKSAGEWQTYDVTLVGRQVTVALNGREVITRRNIPGITGGALDSDEGAPGVIFLQGDHGPVEYRNIVITPAQSR